MGPPGRVLQDVCTDEIGLGCVGFFVLLLIRASSSLCFAYHASRCRCADGAQALALVACASTCLHLVKNVFPHVPYVFDDRVHSVAQLFDTVGIVQLSLTVMQRATAWRTVALVWIEMAALWVCGWDQPYLPTVRWSRRIVRGTLCFAAAATTLPLLGQHRKLFIGLSVAAAATFVVMVTFTQGSLVSNCVCALMWHGSAAYLARLSLDGNAHRATAKLDRTSPPD